jgi:hypothetical protein
VMVGHAQTKKKVKEKGEMDENKEDEDDKIRIRRRNCPNRAVKAGGPQLFCLTSSLLNPMACTAHFRVLKSAESSHLGSER